MEIKFVGVLVTFRFSSFTFVRCSRCDVMRCAVAEMWRHLIVTRVLLIHLIMDFRLVDVDRY
jgi:hypothetical protein